MIDDLVDRALDQSRLFDKSYLDCSANCIFNEVSQIVHLSLTEARNLPLDRHAGEGEVDIVKHFVDLAKDYRAIVVEDCKRFAMTCRREYDENT